MIITNEEKQTLQKWHAEKIKSLSSNLKNIVQADKQVNLTETIKKILDAGERICDIQRDWLDDHPYTGQCMPAIATKEEEK